MWMRSTRAAATLLAVASLSRVSATSPECAAVLSNASVLQPSRFYGEAFVQFLSQDGEFSLRNVAKMSLVGPVDGRTDALCVGFHDTTSYTTDAGRRTMAWATVVTDPAVPAGVLTVDGRCWDRERRLSDCAKEFLPAPGVLDIPMYRHSPLSEAFWLGHGHGHVYRKDWVVKMNTWSREEVKVDSSWVSHLRLSSLKSLEIRGNDWRRPGRLLAPDMHLLERLDLTDNRLDQLPDTLQSTPNLQYLILSANNLSTLPRHLDRLTRLLLLDLTHPKGDATLTISDQELATIDQVRTLGLDNARLDANTSLLLSHPNLGFLNLSGCGIRHVPDLVPPPPHPKPLLYLDLSRNLLSVLPTNIFTALGRLALLDLHDNALDHCPRAEMKHLKELLKLDLSRNRILELDPLCFLEQDRLEELDLSRNRFFRIPEDLFRYATSLKRLVLSHNLLSQLSADTFTGLLRLSFLDLSHNNLTTGVRLEDVTLDTLDLSHNRISHWTVSPVRSLNLSYNPIADADVGTLFGKVEVLDLGGVAFDCCGVHLEELRHWLGQTTADVRSLGRKGPVRCVVPGNPQLYLAEEFVSGRELCPGGDLEDWGRCWPAYVGVGVLAAGVAALATALVVVLCRKPTKL